MITLANEGCIKALLPKYLILLTPAHQLGTRLETTSTLGYVDLVGIFPFFQWWFLLINSYFRDLINVQHWYNSHCLNCT